MWIKKPNSNNDSSLYSLNILDVEKTYEIVNSIINDNSNPFFNEYITIKDKLFSSKWNFNSKELLDFANQNEYPSLNNLMIHQEHYRLYGTNYTYSLESSNSIFDPDNLNKTFEDIKEILSKDDKKYTTRLYMSNTYGILYNLKSVYDSTFDSTCAVGFHYMLNKFNIMFRAHSIHYELIADFCLIYKWIFYPVYMNKKNITWEVWISSTQSIDEELSNKFFNYINS